MEQFKKGVYHRIQLRNRANKHFFSSKNRRAAAVAVPLLFVCLTFAAASVPLMIYDWSRMKIEKRSERPVKTMVTPLNSYKDYFKSIPNTTLRTREESATMATFPLRIPAALEGFTKELSTGFTFRIEYGINGKTTYKESSLHYVELYQNEQGHVQMV